MSKEKWFLGKVTRQKAEEILNSSGLDGSFVIRSSESVSGAYALSVLYCKNVHTYRVLPTDTGLLAVQTLKGVQQRKFSSLDELVKEYKNPQNGLVCGLTCPAGPNDFNQPKPFVSEHPPPTLRSEPLPIPPIPGVLPKLPAARVNSGVGNSNSLPRHIDFQTTLPNDKKDQPARDLPPLPRETQQRAASKSVSAGVDSVEQDSEIKTTLASRFNEIKNTWSGMDNNFMDSVQAYVNENGLDADVSSIQRGNGYCAELQTLLAKEAVAFHRELEVFITKTDILRQLFDHNLAVRKTHAYNRINDSDVDLDAFLGRLRDCQTVVKSLNRKACSSVQSLLGFPPGSVVRSSSRKASKPEIVTERIFEVKQEGALKFSKQKLKMDTKKGTLSIIKADGATEYSHSKVLQLIKSNKSKCKISIVLDGHKKKEFTFEHSFHREAFCQLMQYVRSKHNTVSDPDCVSIFCGSWNMGDAIPPSDISSWFLCNGSGKCLDRGMQNVPHDIYVIGTQETGMQERDWMHRVVDNLQEITGGTFHLVVMDALWHIKIMVIVKEEHKNRISHVQTSTVKTGIANALGNKGAVAVSFQFGGTSFCFINAHLTSGSEKCLRRNNNYHDIIRNLNLGEDRFSIFDLTNRFDHLFFLGDLNYRLEMDYNEIIPCIKSKDFGMLFKADQLRREKVSNKVFSGFNEEEILFPPTYRYERGNRENYAHIKVKKTGVRINVPSWCDRILWRSYPETHNVCHAYGCSDDITTSDHSPLFSNFHVGVRGQYVSNEEIQNASNLSGPSTITFNNVEAILKAPGKSNFYLQFYSVCLTKSVKSQKNYKLDTAGGISPNHARFLWNDVALPKLQPIISDREFLVDQHLLLCLRTEDDNEVHGECVIALRSMIGATPQKFDERLSHKGEDVGQIRGLMLVKVRESQTAPKEKTYDFIQIRRDDEEMKKIKDMGVNVATYADLDEIIHPPTVSSHRPPFASPLPPQPSETSNTANAAVGVYGESEMIEEEGEYADPDLVASSGPSHVLPNRSSPSVPATLPSGRPQIKLDIEKAVKPGPVHHQTGCSGSPTFMTNSISPPVPPNRALPQPPPRAAPQPVARTSFLTSQVPQMTEMIAELRMHDQPRLSPSHSPVNVSGRSPSPPLIDSSKDFAEREAMSAYDKLSYADQSSAFQGQSAYMSNPSSNRLPARQRIKQGRGTPSDVEEFLAMINLLQYKDVLHDSGWDNVEFLGDLTEEDLYEAGIFNPEHRQLILESIKGLIL